MKEKKDHQAKSDLEQEALQSSPDLAIHKIEELEKTNQILLHQIMELSKLVYTQSAQLKQFEGTLLKEFEQLRRVPTSKALGTILYKLFGELLHPINQLDELLLSTAGQTYPETEEVWINAIEISRNQIENILAKWGCMPISIEVGKDEFDPEFHQAIEGGQEANNSTMEENVIVKVVKRGWQINDQIIQFPEVIANTTSIVKPK